MSEQPYTLTEAEYDACVDAAVASRKGNATTRIDVANAVYNLGIQRGRSIVSMLTDEQILEINRSALVGGMSLLELARAIEKEVRTQATNDALESAAQKVEDKWMSSGPSDDAYMIRETKEPT